jgi:hypothetical protein
MKGEAIWRAPAAAEPFSRLRRSSHDIPFGLGMNFLLSFLDFHSCRFARARKPGRMIPTGRFRSSDNSTSTIKQYNPLPRWTGADHRGVSRETFAVTILAASARLRKRY